MKLNKIIGAAFIALGPGTLIFFMYRYIWFAIETVPIERVLTAGVGAFGFGVIGTFLFFEIYNFEIYK